MNTKTHDIIHIYTDSNYLINTYTKWVITWEKNGWKKANGKDVENVELIQDIYSKLNSSGLVVIFKKVKAHQPEPDKSSDSWQHWYGNDRADKLAKLCATDMKEANDKDEEKEERIEKVEKERVKKEVKTKIKKEVTAKIKAKKEVVKKSTKKAVIKERDPTPSDDES